MGIADLNGSYIKGHRKVKASHCQFVRKESPLIGPIFYLEDE